MAGMHHKDVVLEIQPSPHSNFSNHFEDQQMSSNYQNNGPNRDEIEIADMTEHHVEHEFPIIAHSNSPSQSNDQVNENDVIVDLQAMLRDSEESPLSTKSCCIYKVPPKIRQLNERAYTPQLISIGPLHYGTRRLKNMERHKQVLFREFIEQSNTSLDDLVNCVKSLEPKVRACYSEKIMLKSDKLVKLILLDASFIIALFLGWLKEDSYLELPYLRFHLKVDLLLLENQLPFFILEELFKQVFLPFRYPYSFLELTVFFFSDFCLHHLNFRPIKHFTDLLRNFHLNPHTMPYLESPENYELLYTANELYEAGLKFKKGSGNCLLDLKFSGCVLEIPKISIQDRTEVFFRNMIAFEQLQYPYEPYIASYVKVLDCLINTSKDVDILIHQEIISNHLADSNDVAQLFNGLCKNILFSNFNSNYVNICQRLNAFHKDPWNNLKATLRRDYCKTPWQIIASIAGIVLLILTIVQTVFSVIK